jgi:hypothetical protein
MEFHTNLCKITFHQWLFTSGFSPVAFHRTPSCVVREAGGFGIFLAFHCANEKMNNKIN